MSEPRHCRGCFDPQIQTCPGIPAPDVTRLVEALRELIENGRPLRGDYIDKQSFEMATTSYQAAKAALAEYDGARGGER